MDEYIEMCIKEAKKAVKANEVPIGAIIVKNNKIIAKSHNNREKKHDILGHAEINVIKKAAKKLKTWKLDDCDLFITLKPCSMCNNVIKQSRIRNVYYLCEKPSAKKEYNQTSFSKYDENSYEKEYKEILSQFFRNKR